MHRQARRFFKDTLPYAAPQTGGSKGDPNYTVPPTETVFGRLEEEYKLVRNADGDEVQSTHVFITDVYIDDDYVFWFPAHAGKPADDTSKIDASRRPVSVKSAEDRKGIRYLYEVRF